MKYSIAAMESAVRPVSCAQKTALKYSGDAADMAAARTPAARDNRRTHPIRKRQRAGKFCRDKKADQLHMITTGQAYNHQRSMEIIGGMPSTWK
jgi:hypothetical protein